MLKVYITGGDNCYCCECGGICDRCAILVDTKKKTLRYLPCGELCLGKWCWYMRGGRVALTDDWAGWSIVRLGSDKSPRYVLTDGVREIPCVVKNNKWGKDGEYGDWGICRKIDGEYVLVSYDTYTSDNPTLTGWKFGGVYA